MGAGAGCWFMVAGFSEIGPWPRTPATGMGGTSAIDPSRGENFEEI